jgi:hypothetical protein
LRKGIGQIEKLPAMAGTARAQLKLVDVDPEPQFVGGRVDDEDDTLDP